MKQKMKDHYFLTEVKVVKLALKLIHLLKIV